MKLIQYSQAARIGLWFDGRQHFIYRNGQRDYLTAVRDVAVRHFNDSVCRIVGELLK